MQGAADGKAEVIGYGGRGRATAFQFDVGDIGMKALEIDARYYQRRPAVAKMSVTQGPALASSIANITTAC